MITQITYSHPSPTINIGGSYSKYSAEIKFDVCIDSTEVSYKSVLIKGVANNNWSLNDLSFLESIINIIKQLNGKTLKEVQGITSHISIKEEK